MHWENFKGFLDHTTAVLIKRQFWHLHNDAVVQQIDTLLATVLEDHLDYEVTENVPHEALRKLKSISGPIGWRGVDSCVEHVLFVFANLCEEGVLIFCWAVTFNLFLDKSWTLLISAKFTSISKHFFQRDWIPNTTAREAVVLLLIWNCLLFFNDHFLYPLKGSKRSFLACW